VALKYRKRYEWNCSTKYEPITVLRLARILDAIKIMRFERKVVQSHASLILYDYRIFFVSVVSLLSLFKKNKKFMRPN
jgi:hypothetical protein